MEKWNLRVSLVTHKSQTRNVRLKMQSLTIKILFMFLTKFHLGYSFKILCVIISISPLLHPQLGQSWWQPQGGQCWYDFVRLKLITSACRIINKTKNWKCLILDFPKIRGQVFLFNTPTLIAHPPPGSHEAVLHQISTSIRSEASPECVNLNPNYFLYLSTISCTGNHNKSSKGLQTESPLHTCYDQG